MDFQSTEEQEKMKRDGFKVHLYAGPDEGFTLGRAWQQTGGKDCEQRSQGPKT